MPTIIRNGNPVYITPEEFNEQQKAYRQEILGIDESTDKLRHCSAENLGKIWINGQEFTGMAYQGLMTVNTKTYVEEPKRANDGSIPNINDYDTFVVPRCKINFRYFNIFDYQRLCEAIQSNEFVVEYYDKQFNEIVRHKMYCEPEEMVKLYNVGTDVFGVLDYEVSFIGTLNDLEEFTVTYNANGGSIAGNPTIYNSAQTYTRGDKVYLQDNRYYKAIFYVNTFKGQPLTEITYWQNHSLSEFANTAYSKGHVVYESIKDENDEIVGRRYYIALDSVPSDRPLTDALYWQPINVKTYNAETTYSSNKINRNDDTLGQFVVNENGSAIYEAIYYEDTFSGIDPTNTKYWSQLAIGSGLTIKWGKSIVVADPEELFDAPNEKSSLKWNTNPNGTGFTYFPTQSINVFKNLTLYAIWE